MIWMMVCRGRWQDQLLLLFLAQKKREPGQGAQRRDSTTQMKEFFVFPELILFQNFNVISGFHSYFRIWV
jgi:hypothetical protein